MGVPEGVGYWVATCDLFTFLLVIVMLLMLDEGVDCELLFWNQKRHKI